MSLFFFLFLVRLYTLVFVCLSAFLFVCLFFWSVLQKRFATDLPFVFPLFFFLLCSRIFTREKKKKSL